MLTPLHTTASKPWSASPAKFDASRTCVERRHFCDSVGATWDLKICSTYLTARRDKSQPTYSSTQLAPPTTLKRIMPLPQPISTTFFGRFTRISRTVSSTHS